MSPPSPLLSALTKASRSRRDAGATTSPPSIPVETDLLDKYDQLAGYRLLVTYLERFTLEAAIKLRHLSAVEQEAIRDVHIRGVHHHRAPGALPRRWEPDLDRPVQRQDARGRTVMTYPYEKQARQRGRPRAFSLALGWMLMKRDAARAAQHPKVAAEVRRLVLQWGGDPAMLLQLSYVPQEVAGFIVIRRGTSLERRLEANAIRRLRQLEARDRPIPQELVGLSPWDRRLERLWWKGFGLDKESHALSRQRFWGMIVVPLLDALGARHGKISTRRVALDVSQLLRVRYPDLKPPDPELIRKRYDRA